jgi:kumamolisin
MPWVLAPHRRPEESSRKLSVKKGEIMIRRVSVLLLTLAALLAVMSAVSQAQSQALLTRHTRDIVVSGEVPSVGRVPATQTIQLYLMLGLRHQPELQNFLRELYDPHSPSYRHFLTVEEFTARFGASQEDYDTVVRFAKANGFKVGDAARNRMLVPVRGTVAEIEKAFHVQMGLYQHPTENRTFYAPDREPTVDLPFQLWHISNLDNYSIPRPNFVKRDIKVKPNATTGSCPGASFCGSDMRAAYYGTGSLNGAGQTLGLFELLGTDLADLQTYYQNAGQTLNVPITLFSVDGAQTSCLAADGCDDTEQTLDMTQALGMAPNLASLVMYIGNTETPIFQAMATASPLNAQLSCSWYWNPADPKTLDPIFEEFAGQGQNLFDAAGDSHDWQESGSIWPADDANLVSVGGTDLETQSAGGPWKSETAWADGGGGISPNDIPIPSWQVTTADGCSNCSKTYRNGPDVSANSNFTFYVCADQTTCTENDYGGTSFAAPMWAGYLALANQQAVANGQSVLGFIDPALYQIGLGANYDNDFHDITSGSNGYVATVGYDLATGWGSPNQAGLINDLTGLEVPSFGLTANPNSLTVQQGSNGTSTITVNDFDGFSGSVTLSATGMPSGVTAGFSPNPTNITSTLTITVPAGTPTGTSTITVSGVSGTLSSSTTIALKITAAQVPAVVLTPTSLTFGNETVGGTSAAKTVTVRNSGTATLDISSIVASGDFAISSTTCGATLNAGSSCTIKVTFTPTELGARTGDITLTDNAPNSPQQVPLSGTGIAGVTLTPASAKFPATAVGSTSAAKTFKLSNKQSVSLTGISISTTGEFSVSSTTCTSSLAAKSNCSISVVFKPTQTGTLTGILQVSDNAAGSPQTSTLSGTGK